MSTSTQGPNHHHARIQPERFGAGDTYIVLDVLPPEIAEDVVEKLKEEVDWSNMMHRGGEVPRLVAVQGEIHEDGSIPIYRHPSDTSPPLRPFTPTVELIRQHASRVLNQPLNHALIQLYRSGSDYISEHSDKTIDVVRGSSIVNVSVGAKRVMTIRTKKDAKGGEGEGRTTERIPLPHNSMLVMGLETNAKYLHSIRHDNRPASTKTIEELAYDGERISLTFRHIGTFLTADEKKIWGQGAKGKTRDGAREVVNGGEEAEKMIVAFGEENHRSEFDWEAAYGGGYDVLHFTEKV